MNKCKILAKKPGHWASAYRGTIQEVRSMEEHGYFVWFRVNGVFQTGGIIEFDEVELIKENSTK